MTKFGMTGIENNVQIRRFQYTNHLLCRVILKHGKTQKSTFHHRQYYSAFIFFFLKLVIWLEFTRTYFVEDHIKFKTSQCLFQFFFLLGYGMLKPNPKIKLSLLPLNLPTNKNWPYPILNFHFLTRFYLFFTSMIKVFTSIKSYELQKKNFLQTYPDMS